MGTGTTGGNDGPPASELETGELARGSSVGRYLIVDLIGKGGMGEVYAAYDPELNRKVALKLLRAQSTAGVDPSEGKARLLREAQAIAQLSDPNVVVVYDVGTFGDRVFLAMEFVDGSTLGYWMHAKRRPWREIVTTFSAAGLGLAAAHRAGLVHRDFKPDNVMIDRAGKVRVMDFGLARAMGAAGDENAVAHGTFADTGGGKGVTPDLPGGGSPIGGSPAGAEPSTPEDIRMTRDLSHSASVTRVTATRVTVPGLQVASQLTMTGAMMGTPAYMSPEQFRGGSIDARTDQFSFCVALYEGLYGERPFNGKTLHEQTSKVLKGVIGAPPADARVPGWLRRVLARGLRVDRADRFPSMELLLEALAQDPARTRRRWASAGAVGSVILLLGVALVRADRAGRLRCQGEDAKLVGIWERPTTRGLSAGKAAIRQAFMATGKGYAGDSFAAMARALDGYVEQWTWAHRDSCEATHIRGEQSSEVLDLRMACLNDRFSELRALVNGFSQANGDVVSNAVQAAQALRPLAQCNDVAALRAVIRPPEDPSVRKAVVDVRNALAEVKALTNLGRYKKAVQDIDSVAAAAAKTRYEPVVAEALMQKGELQDRIGEIARAEKSYEEAVWTAEGCHHDQVSLEAASWLIANVGFLQDRPVEGERWARFASAVSRRVGPGHEVLAAWRSNNLAMVFHGQGKYEEALELFRQALALKIKALGDNHYDVAISLSNVAYELLKLGRIDESSATNERALAMFRATVGAEHPIQAFAISNRAELMNAKNRPNEAQTFALSAVNILERELGTEHFELCHPLTELGIALLGMGKPVTAIAPLERALRIGAQNEQALDIGRTRFALAQSLRQAGRSPERAQSLAEQARHDFLKGRRNRDGEVTAVERWLTSGEGQQRPQPWTMR